MYFCPTQNLLCALLEIPKKMHLICRQLTEISPDFWAACSFDKVQIIIMVKAFFVVIQICMYICICSGLTTCKVRVQHGY